MDVFNLHDLIIVAAGIIVAIIIIKFVVKLAIKLVLLAIVILFVLYVLFVWHGGLVNLGQDDFLLNELREDYCEIKADEVKCNCIIEPIYSDIRSRYPDEEIDELKGNRVKSVQVIFKSAKTKKDEIKECLRKYKSENKWDEFIDELTTFRDQ